MDCLKKLIVVLSLFIGTASVALAGSYNGTGTVYLLRSHSTNLGPNSDWFSLVGVTSLGNCKTADGGNVVLRLSDDAKGQRQFALVLAAKTAGTPVTAWVDDMNVDSGGYCYLMFVQ